MIYKKKKIPEVLANQLDNYLFGNWKPDVKELFDNFHITKIEYYKGYVELPVLPHRRSTYFFFFLTQGSAIRSKNLNKYHLEKFDFYCLPANQITSMDFLSDDVQGYYCHFRSDIFNQPQLKVNIEKDFPFFDIMAEPVVKIKNGNRVLQIIILLHSEYKRNEMKRTNIIAFHLTALLNEVNFDYNINYKKTSNAAYRITQEYKMLISHEASLKNRVIDFSKEMSITPNHLNKCVKEVTGKSAHQLLSEMRILESKVLLRQTSIPIKEIAYNIGGFESSDFAKFFKKNTGITPSEYRIKKG